MTVLLEMDAMGGFRDGGRWLQQEEPRVPQAELLDGSQEQDHPVPGPCCRSHA